MPLKQQQWIEQTKLEMQKLQERAERAEDERAGTQLMFSNYNDNHIENVQRICAKEKKIAELEDDIQVLKGDVDYWKDEANAWRDSAATYQQHDRDSRLALKYACEECIKANKSVEASKVRLDQMDAHLQRAISNTAELMSELEL